MPNLKTYWIATRPWSFTMTLISISVGTLLAWERGPIHWEWFLITAMGILCIHAAANCINDYFDTRHHVDTADSPTALYRLHPIVTGILTPGHVVMEALGLYAVGCTLGLILAFERSLAIFWIGVAGFVLSFFYTGGPIMYKYRALGEVAVFTIWGPLMISGAYIVQRQMLTVETLWISVPFGIWVALVLMANNMRDVSYDAHAEITTIGMLLGSRRSYILFASLAISTYVYIVVLIGLGMLSPWTLLILLSLPQVIRMLKSFRKSMPEGADAVTSKLVTLFGLCFLMGLFLHHVVPL